MKTKLRLLATLVALSVASGVLLAATLLPFVGTAGLGVRGAAEYWNALPDTLVEPPLPQGSVLLAADGHTPIATLFLYNRQTVPLSGVAPVMRTAIVAIEDSRFYSHTGVDPRGIARAMKSDSGGGAVQGASTLTQQYVKNALLLAAQTSHDPEAEKAATARSLVRKLKEAKLAFAIDAKYSKDTILDKYLNIAYFGAGAYGVEAAAQRYFGVPAARLGLTQAALIAGLVQNPNGYDPLAHPQHARARRDVVLARMRDLGKITPAQYAAAAAAPLGLHPTWPRQGCAVGPVPFYCDWVRQVLESDPALGATVEDRRARLLEGGLRITTAVDLGLQRRTQAAVEAVIPRTHRVAAVAVVVQPGTGRVQAMAVNRSYGLGPGQTEFPLATSASYQPGSTFKAFTLAAALEAGLPVTTRLPGGDHYTSAVFDNPSSGAFSNDADGAGSNLSLAEATAKSVNTAYVQLEEKVGVPAVAEAAVRAGVSSLPMRGPHAVSPREGSLTLGTREVSPLDMASAYATFAAHGLACPPVAVLAVTDRAGTVLPTPAHTCRQAFAPAVADTVTSVLTGVLGPGGTGAADALARPAAGKTGTTTNEATAWFVGYTPQLATAVVMADPRGANAYPLHDVLGVAQVFGGTLPGQIWKAVMTADLAGLPVVPLPAADPGYVATASGPLLPTLVGQPLGQARALLAAAGLGAPRVVAGDPDPATAALVPAGTVLGTVPAPGTPVRPGQRVSLTVSR